MFIEVVVRATGRKQTIPAHWLDHPTLSEPFKLTAREAKKQVEAKQVAEAPAEPDNA